MFPLYSKTQFRLWSSRQAEAEKFKGRERSQIIRCIYIRGEHKRGLV